MFHGFSWGLFGAPLAAWYVIFCRDIEHFEGLIICIIWGILEGGFFYWMAVMISVAILGLFMV